MRKIITRFKSTCNQTGWSIKKGDPALYDPKFKIVYHWASPKAEEFQAEEKRKDAAHSQNVEQFNKDCTIDEAEQNAYFDNFCQQNNI